MAEYSGVRLGEAGYAATRLCRTHNHERAFFSLLLCGAYAEEFAGGKISSGQGQATFHAADTVHRDRIDVAGTRVFIVELMDESLPSFGPQPAVCAPEATWLARRLHQHFREGTLDSLLLEGTLLEMLWTQPDETVTHSDRPRWLGKVVDILHAEFRGPISLEGIATRIGIHPAYLSRRFRAVYGLSLGDYANRLRIRYAQGRLAQPEVSLSEIAHECGFADQPHFTRVFRAQLGTTPGAFRFRSLERF
jgi:AraC family transcriptional regulator